MHLGKDCAKTASFLADPNFPDLALEFTIINVQEVSNYLIL